MFTKIKFYKKRTFNLPTRTDRTIIESQEPTADNNYTWYRKYADGWVEQGGVATIGTLKDGVALSVAATIPIEMGSSNYQVLVAPTAPSYANRLFGNFVIQNATTISVGVRNIGGATSNIMANWQVSGVSASTPTQNIICIKY